MSGKPDPKPDVMADVETTVESSADDLGRIMEDLRVKLGALGHRLIAVIAEEDRGLAIFRAPGVPFSLSEAVLKGLAETGIMREALCEGCGQPMSVQEYRAGFRRHDRC